jgi:polyisoprenoid-binding protein YceI
MKKAITGILIMILAGFSIVSNGGTFELAKTGTEVVIKGTSSLHDWKMDLKIINCGVQFKQEGNTLKSIDNVSFSCKARDIKSESSIMDNKAYDALKAKTYPEIKFTWVSTSGLITDGNKFSGNLKGKLIVAGETRDIIIPFTGNCIDNNTISVIGSTDISMSNFNITPPTAMLGTLKTGDKISVSFTFQFVQKAQ